MFDLKKPTEPESTLVLRFGCYEDILGQGRCGKQQRGDVCDSSGSCGKLHRGDANQRERTKLDYHNLRTLRLSVLRESLRAFATEFASQL